MYIVHCTRPTIRKLVTLIGVVSCTDGVILLCNCSDGWGSPNAKNWVRQSKCKKDHFRVSNKTKKSLYGGRNDCNSGFKPSSSAPHIQWDLADIKSSRRTLLVNCWCDGWWFWIWLEGRPMRINLFLSTDRCLAAMVYNASLNTKLYL